MENKMNIFQKMAAITAELQTVAKNLTVGTGKNTYKAVSERDILDAVKPIEAKYGVYSYPVSREVLESNLLETEKEYTDDRGNTTVTKSTTFMTRIQTTYRFVNTDNPQDYIETITFAEGIDAQDKGSGKAMTYADKYALMKGYKISTGDDPDQEASKETQYTTKKYTPPTAPKEPASKEPTPKQMLIAELKRQGIDVDEFAKEKGLTAKTTMAECTKLLNELKGNEE